MVNIANPIYDSVFKYLLDDRRVAVTILSALLKKKVVEVETRKNEYPNVTHDELSIFRIDFGATIEEEDGSRHLVLIELQKTWLPTETLRFRQYLGWQYSSRENLIKGDTKGNAIPMITIYILGHKVEDLEEPVLYVKRNVYDYNGNIVTKGVPNSFIESLTHDSIIVQIPYLKGRVNNRLEEILSVFDQSNRTNDEHILKVDESRYGDDYEMERILYRLTSAAADAQIRHNMNVEDEYFSLLEIKDTTILQQNHQIAEQGAQLKEQSTMIGQAVKNMLESGMSTKVIASIFGKEEQTIVDIIDTISNK